MPVKSLSTVLLCSLFWTWPAHPMSESKPVVIRLSTHKFQHNGVINDFTFSKDGWFLITVGESPDIHIWNARNGSFIQSFSTPENELQSVSLDDNGTLLAVVGKQRAYIWNLTTGKLIRSIKTEFQFHTPAMISPNGFFFAAVEKVEGKKKHQLTIWDVDRVHLEAQIFTIRPGMGRMSFNPIRSLIAKLDSLGNVEVWNPWTKLAYGTFQKQRKPIQQFAWSPDGQRMVTASSAGVIQLWYVQDKKLLWDSSKWSHAQKDHSLSCLAMISDRYCLAGTGSGLWLWDMKENKRTMFLQESDLPLRQKGVRSNENPFLKIAPDGHTIAIRDGRTVQLFRWKNNPLAKRDELAHRENRTNEQHIHPLFRLNNIGKIMRADPGEQDFPPLFRRSELEKILRAELKEREVHPTVRPSEIETRARANHHSPIRRMIFLNHGKQLLSQGDEKKQPMLVWDTQTGKIVQKIPSFALINEKNANPILKQVKHQIDLDKNQKAKQLETLQKDFKMTNVLALSKDGRMLAGIGKDSHALEVWEISTKKRRFVNSDHKKRRLSITLSPNGRFLATVRETQRLYLWDLCTQSKIWTSPKGELIQCVQFSPNGNVLACGRVDGKIEILNEPIALIRKRNADTFALSSKQMQYHWQQLKNKNAEVVFQSMSKLILAKNQSVEFIEQQFKSIKFSKTSEKLINQDALRSLRAIEILERIATSKATTLLDKLAAKSPTSLESRQATASLIRLLQ